MTTLKRHVARGVLRESGWWSAMRLKLLHGRWLVSWTGSRMLWHMWGMNTIKVVFLVLNCSICCGHSQ